MTTDKPPLDPKNTVCVCKFKGKEVGRVAATAPNASGYMETLAKQYGQLEVVYEEDADYAAAARMLSGLRLV